MVTMDHGNFTASYSEREMVGLYFLGNKEHLFDWQIKGTPEQRKEQKQKTNSAHLQRRRVAIHIGGRRMLLALCHHAP